MNKPILVDGRWKGSFGIGRFSNEVVSRLQNIDVLEEGPHPLAFKSLTWLPHYLHKNQKNYKALFVPGFNPVLYSPLPFVFTICDLIHLKIPDRHYFAKKAYYHFFIKSAAKRAYKIITISEFSKHEILNWLKIPDENVVVAHCGLSSVFTAEGKKHTPAYPYLLHVGNTKPHKNTERLLMAFAHAKIDEKIRLIFTGECTTQLLKLIKQHKLESRIIFCGPLEETQLAEYYRGALAVLFPSLYEGFGLPVLEGMASGIPVLTSAESSLPEISGRATYLVNPYERDAIADGIEQLIHNTPLRNQLIQKGLMRATFFSWDKTAATVQTALDTL